MTLTTPSMVEAPVWSLDGEAADPANRIAVKTVIGTLDPTYDADPALAHPPKGSSKAAQFGPAPAKAVQITRSHQRLLRAAPGY